MNGSEGAKLIKCEQREGQRREKKEKQRESEVTNNVKNEEHCYKKFK